jgi:folylpolyglutamate synthase/dihydropteroate synthase
VESFLGRALGDDLASARNVETPGRLEVVRHGPLVLLDGEERRRCLRPLAEGSSPTRR